ncbi:hypothetical protein RJ639_000327, partial [Escallonia herrerae]
VSLSRFRVLNVEMGSEGPKRVTIHNYFESRGLPTGVSLGSCTVLESAGVGVLPKLYKVLESGLSSINNSSNEEVVWLHLGLNSGVLKFAIERQAVNEATFRCPDELGWQPQQSPIVPGDGGIAQARETNSVLGAVSKYQGSWTIGHGRFVCNYVYYHSLRFAEEKGHKSLFVHVPLFSSINEEAQVKFTAALLEAIASTC